MKILSLITAGVAALLLTGCGQHFAQSEERPPMTYAEPTAMSDEAVEEDTAPIAQPVAYRPGMRRGKPQCRIIPGSHFMPVLGRCGFHMADRAKVDAVSPPRAYDKNCVGKPPGFRYDERIDGPHGIVGIAHRVCGHR